MGPHSARVREEVRPEDHGAPMPVPMADDPQRAGEYRFMQSL